ncbi:MAG: sodium ion-translocating decarboxylase, beta subunit [Clostridia bacterium]|nr:sodium ion-translocating decarboxylase, beta subunit [Clostridia bacterium]
MNILDIFQGISTLFVQEPKIAIFRIVLVVLGIFLVYLGTKGTLEPLIMIPMGFGMSAVNAGVLFLTSSTTGTIFIDPMLSDTDALMNILQIDFLQPIYTFMFSNGLIACIVFMGIGVITDIGFLLRYPFTSMLIAMFAELGTVLTFPIATAMGLNYGEAAAVSLIGGADGPMVLYARAAAVKTSKFHNISSREKLIFAVIANTLLCFLFPVAAPLFLSFFIGIAVRESGLDKYAKLIEHGFLYTGTFFLGLMLGVLCEASTILNPKVLTLLVLGMLSLLISGIGGILGGYIVYFANKKNFNPVIGIAGVSCVPTTAKVAQKEVHKAKSP